MEKAKVDLNIKFNVYTVNSIHIVLAFIQSTLLRP